MDLSAAWKRRFTSETARSQRRVRRSILRLSSVEPRLGDPTLTLAMTQKHLRENCPTDGGVKAQSRGLCLNLTNLTRRIDRSSFAPVE